MKFLVIGSGSIGKRHMRNLLALGTAASNITAVDTRENRRDEVRAMGIEAVHATFEDALAADTYNAAAVCSPTSMHIQQGIELAKRGIHILMEKPLDRDLTGIEDFRKAVADNNVYVAMAYIFRSTPLIDKVRSLLAEDVIGKVLYVRGEFSEYLPDWHPYEDYRSFYMAEKSLGGGSILDQSHIMDLIHHLLGGFKSVYAFNSQVSSLELNADDIAEMVVTLKSGIIASIHTDIFGRDHKKMLEIKGEKGNIAWDHYLNQVRVYDSESKSTRVFSKFPTDFNLGYIEQMRRFIDGCNGGTPDLATLEEGIETMELILAAEKSHETGKVENVGG